MTLSELSVLVKFLMKQSLHSMEVHQALKLGLMLQLVHMMRFSMFSMMLGPMMMKTLMAWLRHGRKASPQELGLEKS